MIYALLHAFWAPLAALALAYTIGASQPDVNHTTRTGCLVLAAFFAYVSAVIYGW